MLADQHHGGGESEGQATDTGRSKRQSVRGHRKRERRSGWEAEGRGWSGKGRLGPAAREQARPQWQGHRVKR